MRSPLRPWRPTPFALLQAGAAVTVLARLARGARRPAPLAPAPGPAPAGGVAVVIPARDEAGRIGPLLAALAQDPQATRIVVVDDESTDGTAALAAAASPKVAVVAGRPLPPGWVGKPWALQQGLDAVLAADPPCAHVVTLDADVVPQPGALAALVEALEAGRYDVLTAGGRFVVGGPAEQALHAAFLAGLVARFGAPGAGSSRPGRLLANGQCLVARTERLAALGGFRAAEAHMTDDIALVRTLAASGAVVGFVDGAQLIDVDMHDSAGEVWREWGRSLPMADVAPRSDKVLDLAALWLAVAAPLPRLLLRRGTVVDLVLLVARLGLAAGLRGSYRAPAPWVLAAPLLDGPATLRLTTATIRPARRWRGRTY